MIFVLFNIYAIAPVKCRTKYDLALGFVESMSHMGGALQTIMTHGEMLYTRILSCVSERELTYIPANANPHMVERTIRTFKEMLDKRSKPRHQWATISYTKFITYNSKLIQSTTEFTKDNARKQNNKLMTYTLLKM